MKKVLITMGVRFFLFGIAVLSASCKIDVQNDEKSASDSGSVVLVASRTSGVAPLSVHLSAEYPEESDTTVWFHKYEYVWNFGDSSSAVWAPTGLSRNTAKGPVSAHVYETPGTYVATLSVKNAGGVIAAREVVITVSDPDNVYAGENTTCVNPADDTDFAGAPAGSRRISTDDLSSITRYATAGSRILLKRGASWSTGNLEWPASDGPVTIGAYGAGAGIDAYGMYSNNPGITVTGGVFFTTDYKQDWRIMDLTIRDPTRTNGFTSGSTDFGQLLFLHVHTEGLSDSIGWGTWNNPDGKTQIDQMAIVSSKFSGAETNVAYVGSERLALLGNNFADANISHVVRVWQAYKSVISSNSLSGSSLSTELGRQALKLHGPMEEEVYSTDWNRLVHRTDFTVISDNIFGSCGPWPVCIGPQNDQSDERLSNIIFERNRYTSDYGTRSPSSLPLSIAVHFTAQKVTVRNNVIDGSSWGNEFTGIYICSTGIAPKPRDIWIYNNTIYRAGAGSEWSGVWIETGSSAVTVRNNLVSFPQAAAGQGNVLILDQGTGTVQSNNLINGSWTFADPSNIDPLQRSFALSPASSDAVDTGYSLPGVYEDFAGNVRPTGLAHDVGAYEN